MAEVAAEVNWSCCQLQELQTACLNGIIPRFIIALGTADMVRYSCLECLKVCQPGSAFQHPGDNLWYWVHSVLKHSRKNIILYEYWPLDLCQYHHQVSVCVGFVFCLFGCFFWALLPLVLDNAWMIKARCSVCILSLFIITNSHSSLEKHIKHIDSIPFYCAWCA